MNNNITRECITGLSVIKIEKLIILHIYFTKDILLNISSTHLKFGLSVDETHLEEKCLRFLIYALVLIL